MEYLLSVVEACACLDVSKEWTGDALNVSPSYYVVAIMTISGYLHFSVMYYVGIGADVQ